ncbi:MULTISPECIES: DUF819 family protein [unclassified Microbulbifer]|uniref:DUF819 family protein n=1 Tax=unclassified Microbulbifer TaxID=2619833 RepID=UPI0027E43A1A|nr:MULTISPECIES: DUF819 family protein [unclassified Microbulbifer]
MITNDAIILGMLAAILGFVFYTAGSEHRFWKRFYRFVPALLLCYFLPSLLTTFGIIDAEGSQLYFVASRYLLPASLVLLTLSIDLKAIINLGPKALILFLTGTLGIVIGGPIALLVMSTIDPGMLNVSGPEAVWRGMTTVAGSWIGGGANQTAMKEIFGVGDQIFSAMVAVDVIVANIWMAVLLFMAGNAKQLDERRGADTRAITVLREKVETLQKKHARIPSLPDLMLIAAVGFGITAIAHAAADQLAPWFQANAPQLARFSFTSQFFWLIVIATTLGVAMAFSPAKKLEGAGSSKVGSVFIYFLVATIGTHMDITALKDSPELFVLGIIWMAVHAGLMLLVAKLIKAPTFFMAVGSQANVGGAASAPVVAAAFHPSLAPVGVLLAVLGYALGTYAAWFCGQLLRVVAGGG